MSIELPEDPNSIMNRNKTNIGHDEGIGSVKQKNSCEDLFSDIDISLETGGDEDILSVSREKFEEIDSGNFLVNDSRSTNTRQPFAVHKSPEIIPTRQSVKGYVIDRLNKKVNSSKVLLGIKDKVVKRFVEGREVPAQSLAKEEISLKVSSVDKLSELVTVEEASECFEVLNSSSASLKTSISLPSSPAKRFECDLENNDEFLPLGERNFETLDLSSLAANFACNSNSEPTTPLSKNSIELKEIQDVPKSNKSPDYYIFPDGEEYPENIYIGTRGNHGKKVFFKQIYNNLVKMGKCASMLSSVQWLLLLSTVIHNLEFLRLGYLTYVFDAIVIAYVGCCLLYSIVETRLESVTQPDAIIVKPNAKESDEELEDSITEGTVQILKDLRISDFENPPNTEWVKIKIEDGRLFIFESQKHSPLEQPADIRESEIESENYDLSSAQFSLVPKGLPKRRLWRKRYPICIKLCRSLKKLPHPNVEKAEESKGTDELQEEEKTQPKAIYLYAITDRDKEFWFWALVNSKGSLEMSSLQQTFSDVSMKVNMSSISYSSLLESNLDDISISEDNSEECDIRPARLKNGIDFHKYVGTIFENYKRMLREQCELDELIKSKSEGAYPVEWLNVVLGRLSYDFLTQEYWHGDVKERIQKKLDKIELPNFVERLEVTEVSLGNCVPQLHSVSHPSKNAFGIWFDFDFSYAGSFQMTLKTRIKLTGRPDVLEDGKRSSEMDELYEEDGSASKNQSPTHGKWVNKFEKFITNKHFQTATQHWFVKKYVGDISNMFLTLTVEVNMLEGILAVNIPPTPSDRIWYGFRKDPVLSISVTPKVGSHEINLHRIVNLIEKKLIQTFNRALVMPNMDDLVIPIMCSPFS